MKNNNLWIVFLTAIDCSQEEWDRFMGATKTFLLYFGAPLCFGLFCGGIFLMAAKNYIFAG